MSANSGEAEKRKGGHAARAQRSPAVMSAFQLFRLSAFALCVVASGCVRRTITVTSEPSGALVWLNGREIGRTPVETDFLYYGTYDVQLEAEGYEPLLTFGQAKPPWWDNIPLDLAAELTPGRKHARVAWHYRLEPRRDDPVELVERARQLRGELPPMPQPPATAPATQPAQPR